MNDERDQFLSGGKNPPEQEENRMEIEKPQAEEALKARKEAAWAESTWNAWTADDFAEAAEEKPQSEREESREALPPADGGATGKEENAVQAAGPAVNPEPIGGSGEGDAFLTEPEADAAGQESLLPEEGDAFSSYGEMDSREAPDAHGAAEKMESDFVENNTGATVENSAATGAPEAPAGGQVPPMQGYGYAPVSPAFSGPGIPPVPPGQMPPFGGNSGGQPMNSTGYQHSQPSFPQPGQQPYPQQATPYAPLPYSNGYPPQQGRPPVYPPPPGYPAPPPPYQPMYGAPGQQPPAYQWPEHHAGMAPGTLPPKKKMERGTKIFLWIACSLAACFVLGFGIYGAYVASSGAQFPADPGSSDSRPGWNLPSQSPNSGGQQPSTPGSSGANDPNWGGADLRSQPEGSDPMDGNAVYEKAKESVVGIRLYEPDADLDDSYISEGSGVIMTEDGYIITNSHVLGDSNTYGVQVVLYSGEEYVAKVVGFDKRTDLAVIKIDASGLTAAELGNSDELRVGNRVYALGNPGGLNYFNSLTGGWVSALDRAVESTAQTAMRYIQTDAAINPGNSGGALLNRFGQVVGINTAKIQGYEGMGFAIPMSTAKEVIDDLMRYGYVAGRVRLGITGQQLSTYVAQKNGVPQGVLIKSISDDSPLRSQGIQVDDIITHINGVEITAFDVLTDELANFRPGDTVTLTIHRGGKSFDVDVLLLEDKGETQQPTE